MAETNQFGAVLLALSLRNAAIVWIIGQLYLKPCMVIIVLLDDQQDSHRSLRSVL